MDIATAASGAALAGFGALAPDLDHPRSLIGNRIPVSLLVVGVALMASPVLLRASVARGGIFAGVWQEALLHSDSWPKWGAFLTAVSVVLLFASFKATAVLEHRGPLHSIAAAVVATGSVLLVCAAFGLWPLHAVLFGLGWSTHLLADATTPTGLPYLTWPLGSPESARGSGLFLIPVALVILIGLFSWFSFARVALSSSTGSTAHPVPSESVPAAEPMAPHAILETLAPDVMSTLIDPENPMVEKSGAGTEYTWVYLEHPTPDTVVAKQVILTIDETGKPIGVEYR